MKKKYSQVIKKTISIDFSKEKVKSPRRGNVLDDKNSVDSKKRTALVLNRKPLGKLVGSGNQGKVFRLGSKVTKVYKDQAIAAREFELLKELADTGVTPKPISINGNRVQMEAVGGSNLGDAFKSGMFDSLDSLSNLAINLSDSIKAIHEKGIVHGDLGLDNIIIDRNGKLRIIDLARGFKTLNLDPDIDLKVISSLKDDKLFSDTLYKRYFNL